jgi:large subunit ribosomal protein L24
MKIRKDDEVLVITGDDRGKKGKVRRYYPREDRLVVEGANMVRVCKKCHEVID